LTHHWREAIGRKLREESRKEEEEDGEQVGVTHKPLHLLTTHTTVTR
jgi:hypothetical protein